MYMEPPRVNEVINLITAVAKSLATLEIFFKNYEKLIIFGLIYIIDCLIY